MAGSDGLFFSHSPVPHGTHAGSLPDVTRFRFATRSAGVYVLGSMNVTRVQIVFRGLTNRCPNCGERTLFARGKLFELNKTCPSCGFRFDRGNDEGFFLGSMSLNYGVTLVAFLLPVALLAFAGVIGSTTAIVLAVVGAVLVPVLLYRSSRSWFLMNYYFFLPHHLPANSTDTAEEGDPNT